LNGVEVVDGRAYLAVDHTGMQIVDVSDPTSPAMVGVYGLPFQNFDVRVFGSLAYLASDNGFHLIDIQDAQHPTLVGANDQIGRVTSIDVLGEFAFAANGALNGLKIIDTNELQQPAMLGAWTESLSARGVHSVDGLAYVAVSSEGLQIIDVQDPSNPIAVGSYEMPGFVAFDVHVEGQIAHVVDGESGIYLLDVSEPEAPSLLSSYQIPGYDFERVHVDGSRLFAISSLGTYIIDISDPASPAFAGGLPLVNLTDADTDGELMFVARRHAGLEIYDVSQSLFPHLESTYAMEDALGLTVIDDIAYVVDELTGLQLIDIHDPAQPTLMGSFDTPSSAFDVEVVEGRAFITDQGAGLIVVDVRDPTNLVELGRYDAPGTEYAVSVDGSVAYLASLNAGLITLDVAVCSPCSADLNGDGLTNFFDVSAFLVAYLSQDSSADFNGDGSLNYFDVSAFLQEFAIGCP
jgi:hypothetical protein